MKYKPEVVISDLGGWDYFSMCFSPGWSTGPENGPWENGIGIETRFDRPFKVGGILSLNKTGHWLPGGVIKKKDAIALARMILKHYNL